jgi:hypothetical protein
VTGDISIACNVDDMVSSLLSSGFQAFGGAGAWTPLSEASRCYGIECHRGRANELSD